MKRIFLYLALSLTSALAFAEKMKPLDDGELSGIAAREGIALNFEMLISATKDNSGNLVPETCPSTGISAAADCRFALQFNSIDDAWLVVKDWYGLIGLNAVHIDGVRTESTPSGNCDSDCQNRFGTGFDPYNKPAIQLSYDHSDLGAAESFYDDANIFLHAGAVVAEFNTTGNTQGYLNDVTPGSAIGLLMADGVNGAGGPAQIRFDGNMQMFGY